MSIPELLLTFLPKERIKSRLIDVLSYASDAGFYHLVPRAVVQPVSQFEIVELFRFSHQHNVPLVFRTGGTSLSGQAITDGVLVDLSQYWSKIEVLEDGAAVRVQPGITGAMVNAHLKKYQRKIGPDPSSISAAMMGGILSNNSSGMCCGVAMNSYHTTRHIAFILPNGLTYNTAQQHDYERFEQECPGMFAELVALRTSIINNNGLHHRIRQKYRTKNTVGYSLNALIDYEHPLDILAHLLIGAEGTLAFIAEAVMDTVPDYRYKSTALLYFSTMYAACQAIVPLTEAGAMMVELMDRASLRAVENMDGMPAIVKTLPDGAAALLIEFQEAEETALTNRVNTFLQSAAQFDMLNAPVFTTHSGEQAFLWKVRKGLFPAVGAVRASGTTVILEDIAFPVARLGDAIVELQALFKKYAYHNAIIFGHAKDGNIHFVVTQSFNTPAEIERYDRFMQDVIALVVEKYDGTLKAEHGTGRNMAPFVQTEWGADAYDIMCRLKAVIDPQNLLNPGVIINSNAKAHIQHLKQLPTVEEEVDRCIECGYCEHRCPSRNLTTTPRRRIVVRRALQQLQQTGQMAQHQQLLDQYQYEGLDTCAVDGLCATACPVDINTGDLVKRLRRENHSAQANKRALWVAKNFALVERMARVGLQSGHFVNRLSGGKALPAITAAVKKVLPAFPLWTANMPSVPKKSRQQHTAPVQPAVVYFPACISRTMGAYAGRKSLAETFLSVCNKVGIGVKMPANLTGTCCSQIFGSKGFKDAYAYTANNIVEKLWEDSMEGKLPVVTDVSSCTYTLRNLLPVLNPVNRQRYTNMRFLDSVDFLHDYVLPNTSPKIKKQRVVLHPVCSLEKMKTTAKFEAIARAFASEVVVPLEAGCCGMAGDRGFLFPELTAAATAPEANEVKTGNFDGCYSSTKTCEMALAQATGKNYESILYLADDCL